MAAADKAVAALLAATIQRRFFFVTQLQTNDPLSPVKGIIAAFIDLLAAGRLAFIIQYQFVLFRRTLIENRGNHPHGRFPRTRCLRLS